MNATTGTCTIRNCDTCNNIRNARNNASERNVIDGRAWYATMGARMNAHASTINKSAHIVAAVYAAFSINTQWNKNKNLAEEFFIRYMAGTHREMTGTLGMNIRKAIDYIEQDTHNFETMVSDKNNFKIRNFTCNLTDNCIHDVECVTVDRWAHRIATNFGDCKRREGCAFNKRNNAYINNTHACGHVPTGTEYQTMAACYRNVAAEFNESARVLQAITWTVFAGSAE